MTNDALLAAAVENTGAAQVAVQAVHTVGQQRPVPAQMFTIALVHLRNATSAMTELECRAQGHELPKQG